MAVEAMLLGCGGNHPLRCPLLCYGVAYSGGGCMASVADNFISKSSSWVKQEGQEAPVCCTEITNCDLETEQNPLLRPISIDNFLSAVVWWMYLLSCHLAVVVVTRPFVKFD